MTERENRITDASLIGDLKASVSFYANTTIYIIAGLIAVAGTLERVVSFTEDLPFARQTSREVLEAKMFVLIGIFIFAYFKFTWSLRQFNFLSILLGATPPKGSASDVLERAAERFALMSSLAGDEFNRGIRAYYFGFAVARLVRASVAVHRADAGDPRSAVAARLSFAHAARDVG